jgi:hypothetical protein
MIKPTIFLFLILIIFSCENKSSLPVNESLFKNKTFSLLSKSEKDTITIEFQDSTCQIFRNFREEKLPWRIYHYEESNFLVLEENAFGIEKIDNENFTFTYIGLRDYEFTLKKRGQKWDENLIFGIWVKIEDDKAFDNRLIDSIPKPPPPPKPYGISEMDYIWPSYYVISRDSIKFYKDYSIEKSKIAINNTNEYLLMELGRQYSNEKNWQWKIKSLTKNKMVIERRITDYLFNETLVMDTLVKKNVS